NQGYILLGNIWNGKSLWFGRRFYDRKDIHMADYFWFRPNVNADYGGGIEGLHLVEGKLDIAFFKNIDVSPTGGQINNWNLDFRWRDALPYLEGKLTLWAAAFLREESNVLNLPARYGYGLGGWYDTENIFDIDETSNTTVFLARSGAAVSGGTSLIPREVHGYDLKDSWSIEVNNNFLYDAEKFAVQWMTLARWKNFGQKGVSGDLLSWYSTGIRPVYYLTDHVNIAWESGVDYVDNQISGIRGSLFKHTLALQWSAQRGYYTRPVVRLFATYAHWSSELEGHVGGSPFDAPYADDREGMTYGIQFEAWW
ncbi:MAG: carbohydrate porin, partial [Lentisphaeraceae bacterium]|nr:carbohydrate porin [Lentisphaeraceae bacterium]